MLVGGDDIGEKLCEIPPLLEKVPFLWSSRICPDRFNNPDLESSPRNFWFIGVTVANNAPTTWKQQIVEEVFLGHQWDAIRDLDRPVQAFLKDKLELVDCLPPNEIHRLDLDQESLFTSVWLALILGNGCRFENSWNRRKKLLTRENSSILLK